MLVLTSRLGQRLLGTVPAALQADGLDDGYAGVLAKPILLLPSGALFPPIFGKGFYHDMVAVAEEYVSHYFARLVLKGIYHYWKCVFWFQGA